MDKAKREHLFTVSEVAWHLRVDNATVRYWVREGLLEAIELPTRGKRHNYRFKESILDAFYEKRSDIREKSQL